MAEPTVLIIGRGRRPRCTAPSRRRVEFRMTDEEQQRLKDVAASEGKPVAEVIRDAVNEYTSDFTDEKTFVRASGG